MLPRDSILSMVGKRPGSMSVERVGVTVQLGLGFPATVAGPSSHKSHHASRHGDGALITRNN